MGEKQKKAPDGGWGWFIVVGFAVSNIISIPVLQSFGLLFRNIFHDLELSATDISTIINVNSGFGLMLGLMNGPLLRKFGYRKMAMVGSLIMFVGFVLTSRAETFIEFIVYYGVINSIGFSWQMASFSLAINTYFRENRAMAAGVGTTLTGLGPVFMPLLISSFVEIYGARGTSLILSGLLLHSFASSLLLHPIKWHYKIVPEDDVIEKEMQILCSTKIEVEKNKEDEEKKDEEVEEIEEGEEEVELYESQAHGIEGVIMPRRVSDITGRRSFSRSKLSLYENDKIIEPESMWWKSKISTHEEGSLMRQESRALSVRSVKPKQKWYMKVVKFFDLDLLKDPVYRNIWIGMSVAFTGEINFSLMTPIILGDRKFSIEQTARIMSVIATADIIFRFLAPFIGDRTKIPVRHMYMISLGMLILTRFAFTFAYSFYSVIAVGVFLGIAKGFRTVYMTLVIPNHVPLEKLPSASGLQTVLNGILLLSFGPIVGFARDYFGNYNIVIHLINLLSFFTILLWSIEMLCMSKKPKKNVEQT